MKRILLLFSVLSLMLSAWATSFTVNGVAYNITNSTSHTVGIGTGTVTAAVDKLTTAGVFTIPSSVAYGGITYSVTSVGPYAFYECNRITSVIIPNTVTKINSSAFETCSGLTSLTIPNSVISIGSCAFLSCTGLTSITLSNSLTTIGGSAFQNCKVLTSVTFPASVTSIGDYSFYYCSKLSSVFIPGSVTYIGINAFNECGALTSLYVRNTNPSAITLGSNVFYPATVSTCKLYVPEGSLSAYNYADQWGAFANKMEEGSNALSFDGANDYVAIPTIATNLSTFSIEMWIKPTIVPATSDIALINTSTWDGNSGSSVHFQIEGSKVLISVFGLSVDWPSSNYTPQLNTWQHIAVTYDKPNSAVKFYVNGVLVSTVNKALPFAKIDAACLGAWGGSQRFFNGAIDEVRVWNTVRTAAEIADNKYNLPNNPSTTTGLLLNYSFNQGVAGDSNGALISLPDLSANYLNGTLKNFNLEKTATSNYVAGVVAPSLIVSANTADIGAADNSTTTVNVTSNTPWTAISDQSWLIPSPAAAAGNGTLTFTASANTAETTRTATVTVSGTAVAAKIVTVTQAAAVHTGVTDLEFSNITVNAESGDLTLHHVSAGTAVSLFNMSGKLLYSRVSTSETVVINLPAKGIYIVKAGNTAKKVVY